jgi:hypothetical protein
VWFWAIATTVISLFVLFAGSQIAHDRGQSVAWYTGFGQWLGGLGSLIAAAVALWIAVTERRHVDRQQEADLARQAGLVQVAASKKFGKRDIMGPRFAAASVSVRNRRTDRIFDVELTRFVMQGNDIGSLEFSEIELFPESDGASSRRIRPTLDGITVAPDQLLLIFPNDQPDIPADYASVEYTDSSGRRWHVDTDKRVRRITSP